VAAACPGNLNTAVAGRLFFIYDAVSAKKLLVDTGSSFSIFPFRSAARPSGPRLKAANGQRIRCWGSRRRELRIADKVYKWQFLQADVSFPIFFPLTVVDRTTRWLEAIPLRATAAAGVADAFVRGWVARFGLPAIITSDRGVQFTSALWAAAMKLLGIKHQMSTAFHPQSNGLVERAHRRLKEALKAKLVGGDWPSHLPWILLGLRTTPREDSGLSMAELVYGSALLHGSLVTTAEPPPELFGQHLRSAVPCVATRQPPASQSAAAPLKSLLEADFIYVRSPPAAPALSPACRGPYKVVQMGDKYFMLKIGDRFDAISVDRLKPHLGPSVPAAALPPKRGHPSKTS
jgi:hypothetical protein